MILVFIVGKLITVYTNEAVIEYLEGSQDNQGNLLSYKPLECGVMQKYLFKTS